MCVTCLPPLRAQELQLEAKSKRIQLLQQEKEKLGKAMQEEQHIAAQCRERRAHAETRHEEAVTQLEGAKEQLDRVRAELVREKQLSVTLQQVG